jgi:hypothetical protein
MSDYKRGTVEFDENWTNYSFHHVIIKAPIVIRECNFAQAVPETDSIDVIGNGEVKFIDCNLSNVVIDPKWIIENCCTVQSWIVEELTEDGDLTQTRRFICKHPDELTEELKIPPKEAILGE